LATLSVLSARGDTRVTWNPELAASGQAEALAAIQEAERIFRQERARGSAAFRVTPDEPAVRIDQFDPQAEEIIIVPRMAGG